MPEPINPYESPAEHAVKPPPPAAEQYDPELARVAEGWRFIYIAFVISIVRWLAEFVVEVVVLDKDNLHLAAKFFSLVLLGTSLLWAIGGVLCWATPANVKVARIINIYSFMALACVPLAAGEMAYQLDILPGLPSFVFTVDRMLRAAVMGSFLLYTMRMNRFLRKAKLMRRAELLLIVVVARYALPDHFIGSAWWFREFLKSPRDILTNPRIASLLATMLVATLIWMVACVAYANLIYHTRQAILRYKPPPPRGPNSGETSGPK